MKREDFSWTKFSHENVTMISRIEAIRKIIDHEVGLEPCLSGIAEIEQRYDALYHDYIDGKLKHRELYDLASDLDMDIDKLYICWHEYKNACNEPLPYLRFPPNMSRNPCGHEKYIFPKPPIA